MIIFSSRQTSHSSQLVETVFQDLFAISHNTQLIGGAAEPVYWPAGFAGDDNRADINRLYYRQDYFASALHEVAHWCIAGEKRRRQVDFGYWYVPDGRTIAQQTAFQQVEVAPQALEWIFSVAADYRFRISPDNLLATDVVDNTVFAAAVREKALHWCACGLPERAARLATALADLYGIADPFNPARFAELPA